MPVCLVSQIDQLIANLKIYPQYSQHVYSYEIISGTEEKVVNFVLFFFFS